MAEISKAFIEEYEAIKLAQRELNEREKAMRTQIIEHFFPTAGEGTHITLFEGCEIKGTIRYNYKILPEEYEENKDSLSDHEAACIDLKPTLKLSNYRKLDEFERSFLDEIIEIKPGLPSLKIEAAPELAFLEDES